MKILGVLTREGLLDEIIAIIDQKIATVHDEKAKQALNDIREEIGQFLDEDVKPSDYVPLDEKKRPERALINPVEWP